MIDLVKFRRLFEQMRAVLEVLKLRQRTALTPLYAHPNMQVRLKAAKNTLPLLLMLRVRSWSRSKPRNTIPKPWRPGCASGI